MRLEGGATRVAEEGTTLAVRMVRNGAEGALAVRLELEGSARRQRDYHLAAPGEQTAELTFVIPDGQIELELELEIVDDSSAEPEEAVVLHLLPDVSYQTAPGADSVLCTIPANDFVVTNTNDAGEGSLRQAILNANALDQPEPITFDASEGPFATPQTILLESPLPEITRAVTIDGYIPDRLWSATGVTISGGGTNRVLAVAGTPDAQLTLRHITIADGLSTQGAAVLSKGRLLAEGVTFVNNKATADGGAVANDAGTATVINSTFSANTAGTDGGGFANLSGSATITNSTFSDNGAERGGAVFNQGALRLTNTILANSLLGDDCVSLGAGVVDNESYANLIEVHQGCGTPLLTEDPRLGKLGYFNGPTQTLPLGGGSPAINLGRNEYAVDATGAPLVWDQRGNGDPRFVGGFTDIGAFEHQRFPDLTVDTTEDNGLRACTNVRAGDCPLRAAVELANATEEHDVIRFDTSVFAEPQTLELERALPELLAPVTLDASGTAGVTLAVESPPVSDRAAQVTLINVFVRARDSAR